MTNARKTTFLAAPLAAILIMSGSALAAPGDHDPHFGNNGVVKINAGDYDEMADMALDGNKVVAVGRYFDWDTLGNDVAIARFTASGQPDSAFSTDGVDTEDLGTDSELARAVLPLPGGGYLVAGSMETGADVWSTDTTLIRYTESGEVDTTWGTNGIVTINVNSIDSMNAVAVQPDGKIVLAGRSGGPSYIFTVIRVHPDGTLDTNADSDPSVDFSEDGKAFADAGGSEQRIEAITLQSDGKIVLVGQSGTPGNTDWAMSRLMPDGSVDTTFGTDGFIHEDMSSTEWIRDVALQSNGKIVVAGGSYVGEQGLKGVVGRYTVDGDPDPSFGDNGLITGPTGAASHSDGLSGLVIQPDGKLVAAGEMSRDAVDYNYLVRLRPAGGTPDGSFGNWRNGFSRFATPPQHTFGDLLFSNGRILLGGQTSDTESDFYALAVVAVMKDSSTAVNTSKNASSITATGKVIPNHAGRSVVVRLEKQVGGHFSLVTKKKDNLNSTSHYEVHFARPGATDMCRVTTIFPGDAAHRPSRATKTFAC